MIVGSAIEGAVVIGSLSALSAAISTGVRVIQYEAAIKANGFIAMAHGGADEMVRAKAVRGASHPTRVDLHEGATLPPSADQPVTI